MSEVLAKITHGALPSTATLVDEPDLLVESLTVTPTRDEKEFKGANRAARGLSYTNPKISFKFEAYVDNYAGLAIQHPGTAVDELANFAGARFGFDPAQGTMIYKDPSLDLSSEDEDKLSFEVVQFPFVVNA